MKAEYNPMHCTQLCPDKDGSICIALLLTFLFLPHDYFMFALKRCKQSSGYSSLYSLQKHDLGLSRVRLTPPQGLRKEAEDPGLSQQVLLSSH